MIINSVEYVPYIKSHLSYLCIMKNHLLTLYIKCTNFISIVILCLKTDLISGKEFERLLLNNHVLLL